MKVLLLGEFSGVHMNLSSGLKEYGIDVTLASGGDDWKNIYRDIDLSRDLNKSKANFMLKLVRAFPKLVGYDVIQLNNYKFLSGTPELNNFVFDCLRLVNKNVFLGAHGMDPRYINYALSGILKYSIFQVPEIQNDTHVIQLKNLVNDAKEIKLSNLITSQANGIIASSYGYYKAYNEVAPIKTTYIPLPIDTNRHKYVSTISKDIKKIRFLLGLMKGRVVRKGTDVIYGVLKQLKEKYPNDIELKVVDSVPYREYQEILNSSHVLCDQLYSYGIGLNALLAQSKGLIVAGGGDEDMYNLLNETDNRPIININTNKKMMFKSFENLLDYKQTLPELSLKNREFVVKHHDSLKVANQYIDYWKNHI